MLTLIKKEIMESLISVRFFLLLVLSFSLIPFSLYVNARDYETKMSNYRQSNRLFWEEWNNRDLMELFYQKFAVKGYREPSPLSVFVNGLDNVIPNSFEAQKSGLTFENNTMADNSILALAGNLDFMFIIHLIFSLLAILFTFDSISGEKEKGTLKISMANSISRTTYIMSKYVAFMAIMLVPLFLSIILGILVLISSGFPVQGNNIMIHIALLFFTALILVSIFISLGMFISSKANSSKTSIVILLLLWAFMIFIIPKASEIAAQVVIPVKSREVVQLEKTLLRRDLEKEKGAALYDLRQNQKLERESLECGTKEEKALRSQHSTIVGEKRAEYDRKIELALNTIEQQYQLKKEQQHLMAITLARISPITSFIKVMSDLADTGMGTNDLFHNSAMSYWVTLNEEMFRKLNRDINPDGRVSFSLSGSIDHRSITHYQFNFPPLSYTIRSITADGLVLILFMILSFVLSYVSFLKYDIR